MNADRGNQEARVCFKAMEGRLILNWYGLVLVHASNLKYLMRQLL